MQRIRKAKQQKARKAAKRRGKHLLLQKIPAETSSARSPDV
jgi:hypothetical protein